MDGIDKQISNLQQQFYAENKKKSFFKNSQKQDLAKPLVQEFNLTTLLSSSIYIIPDTNIIYMDYPILKTFLFEDIYEKSINFILEKYSHAIQEYNSYVVQVNLKGFTISAAQRYQKGIMMFTDKCNNSTTKFAELMEKMVIINAPSMMETINNMMKPFIDPILVGKIHFQSNK